MPALKTRSLFISHAWSYESHYNTIVDWFYKEPNFIWKNYSVPSNDSCLDRTKIGLKLCLTRQINPAQGIIILAGMWAAHSEWIEYEVDEAIRLNKTIIGVKPWGHERTPVKVRSAATVMVNWQRSSLIEAVRYYI